MLLNMMNTQNCMFKEWVTVKDNPKRNFKYLIFLGGYGCEGEYKKLTTAIAISILLKDLIEW